MKVLISNNMTIKFSTLIATLALCLAELPRSSTAADRLPDLGMAWLSDLTIDNTTDGRRLLCFTTIIVNIGAGAFELHGKRASTPFPANLRSHSSLADSSNRRELLSIARFNPSTVSHLSMAASIAAESRPVVPIAISK